MSSKAKEFLVSTANFALFYNDVLACTGTTNLDSSIEVSMQEQNVNAGKGNKLIYSFKYGRELNVSLQAADWKLEYIAAQVGSEITEGLADAYKIGECITINGGIGVLPVTPIGDVAVELPNGTIVVVQPTGTTIDLSTSGVTSGTVNVTYKFNEVGKTIVIDAESSPKVFKLVLDADKHSNKLGKIGSVQIEVPSYQPSGNFTISFTPDGVTSTNIDGKALAVEGDTCDNGDAVYAYIREFDSASSTVSVSDIAATPSVLNMAIGDTKDINVIGLRGALYSSISIDNADCTFSTGDAAVATAINGVIEAIGTGSTNVIVDYNGCKDVIEVTVS